jgi:hypothetical protein
VESHAEAEERADDVEGAATTADRPAAGTAATRTLWGEPLGRLLVLALAMLAVAAAVVMPTALRVHGISVFDEATHVDYAYQVAHGHLPARGSVLAPEIRAELVCRGSAIHPSKTFPHCGESNPDVKLFGVGAQNYNFGHPPLYYAITGLLARAAGTVSSHHFITFARLVGVLWLFAGMLVMYLGLRRFRVRWVYAACGALLVALTPAIFYYDAFVTNDAAAALSGSLAVLMLARILVGERTGWVLPGVLGGLAAATKTLNALPFLAGAVLLAALALTRWRVDRTKARQLLLVAGAIVLGVLVVYGGWTLIQNHRGDPNWVNPIAGISSQPVHGAPFDELFSTSFSSINLLSAGYLPDPFPNNFLSALIRLWGPLSVAAVGAVLALQRRWSPRFVLAGATALGVLTFPLVVEIQVLVTSHKYFPVVIPRYGMSYIPMLLAAMAIAADDRRLRRSLIAFTAFCLGVAMYTVFSG